MKGLVKAIFDIDTILVRFILRTFGLIVNAEVSTFFFKKKVFLEISQNSQENTCTEASFLIKLQANFIKKQTVKKTNLRNF